MKEIEIRALMGDREAQEECTRLGIAIPCPYCGRSLKVEGGRFFVHPFGGQKQDCYNASFYINCDDEGVLRLWNTRQAPPVGHCGECAAFENHKCKNTGYYSPENGFCHDFAPKEAAHE